MSESLPERLARATRERLFGGDTASSARNYYFEERVVEECAAAIRAALDEAAKIVLAKRDGKSMLNPGLEVAAAVIEALKGT